MWVFNKEGYVVDFRSNSKYFCVPLKFNNAWHINEGVYSITTKAYVTINVTKEELEEGYVKQYTFSEVVQMMDDIQLIIAKNEAVSKLEKTLKEFNLNKLSEREAQSILHILGY